MKASPMKLAFCVLFLLLISVSTISVVPKIWNNIVGTKPEEPEVVVDLGTLYKFEAAEETEAEIVPVRKKTIFDKIETKIGNIAENVNDYCYEYTGYYLESLEFYGHFSSLLGKKSVEDKESVYRLQNGYLASTTPDLDEEYFAGAVANVVDFREFLDELGIEMIQVVTSNKGDESLGQLPAGVDSHYHENSVVFMDMLVENEVPVMDMTQEILDDGLDVYDMFYITDHHWNIESGRWGAAKIAERINADLGWDLDLTVFDRENYESEVYEDIFLGSYGQRVSMGYTEPEDFEVLTPKFDTSFTISNTAYGVTLEGTFEEVLLDYGKLREDYYDANLFQMFMWGDRPLISLENNLCDNGKRVCVIKDSKARVITLFLANAVQYLDIIDPRYYDASIRAFIEATEPDLVLNILSAPSTDALTRMPWEFK